MIMRRTDKEITDKLEQYEILTKGQILRLAMSLNDEPYVVPMNYGFKDGELFLHSALEGRKVTILKKNPKVCFEVSIDTELIKNPVSCKWTYYFRSVIGRGKVVFLETEAEKRAGLDVIMTHFGSIDNSYKDEHVRNINVFKIVIEEMTGKASPVKRD